MDQQIPLEHAGLREILISFVREASSEGIQGVRKARTQRCENRLGLRNVRCEPTSVTCATSSTANGPFQWLICPYISHAMHMYLKRYKISHK